MRVTTTRNAAEQLLPRQGFGPAKDMSAVGMRVQEALPEKVALSAISCHYQRTVHVLAPADCSQQRTADAAGCMQSAQMLPLWCRQHLMVAGLSACLGSMGGMKPSQLMLHAVCVPSRALCMPDGSAQCSCAGRAYALLGCVAESWEMHSTRDVLSA